MSTRRRPRTRLWSWSPSRRRRHGPRTSARPRRRAARGAVAGGAGCCRSLLVPVVLVLLLVIAWAVDSSSGGVARNVQLAGVDIGGLSEDELAGRVGDVAAELHRHPGRAGRRRRRLRDHRRRHRADGRRGGAPPRAPSRSATARSCSPGRSRGRARSSRSGRRPLQFQVNAEQVAATVVALEGDARTPPTEPTVELVDGAFEVVPGVDGAGLDTAEIAAAAARASPRPRWPRTSASSASSVEVGPIPPLGSEEAAAGRGRRRRGARERAGRDPHERRQPHDHAPSSCARGCSSSSNPDGTVVVDLRRGQGRRHPPAGVRRRRGAPRRTPASPSRAACR